MAPALLKMAVDEYVSGRAKFARDRDASIRRHVRRMNRSPYEPLSTTTPHAGLACHQ
jgi:hypothetical protein